MNTDQTLSTLRALKLNGMANSYQVIVDCSGRKDLPDGHTMVGMITDAEADHRKLRRTESNLKQAKLRYKIDPQEIECSKERGLTKEQWLILCECSFIKKGTNVIILGPTGVGKSAVACALGKQACYLGYRAIYHNMNKLIEEIRNAKLNGTYLKFLDQLAKTPVLILDDFALKQLDREVRVAFYEILEDRADNGSLIVTSQLPTANWYDRFGDKTIAEACMDRMTGNAVKIQLSGESRRTRQK